MTDQSTSRPDAQDPRVPVLLPHIRIDATAGTDVFDLTTNVQSTPAGDDLRERVAAGDLGGRISALVQQAQTAVRVEIHAPGGAVHADILHPPDTTGTEASAHVARSPVDVAASTTSGAVIEQDGWIPGEQVLIAAVLETAQADEQGMIQLPTDDLDAHRHGPDGRVVLVGQSSGSILERRVP